MCDLRLGNILGSAGVNPARVLDSTVPAVASKGISVDRSGSAGIRLIRNRCPHPLPMELRHPDLVELLQRAYSAERAAALAYVGHAKSLAARGAGSDPAVIAAVKRIEQDEWDHRGHVLSLMRRYEIPVSRFYEFKFLVVGKLIGASCHVIGRFMPFFFAGRLESGNVCEYFVMMQHFHSLGIRDHDVLLYEMGIKEKEHELYFLDQVRDSRWLPFFEWLFSWGPSHSVNDIDLTVPRPVPESHRYCKTRHHHVGGTRPGLTDSSGPSVSR